MTLEIIMTEKCIEIDVLEENTHFLQLGFCGIIEVPQLRICDDVPLHSTTKWNKNVERWINFPGMYSLQASLVAN